MTDALRIDREHLPDAVVVHFDGDIDLANAATLREAVLGVAEAHADACVIGDLTDVTYLDSAGIEMLFALYAAVGDGERSFVTVAAPGTAPHRLLQLAAVGDVGPVRGSVAEAVERCLAGLRPRP